MYNITYLSSNEKSNNKIRYCYCKNVTALLLQTEKSNDCYRKE